MKRLVAATLARFGQIDVLVNNAALYAPLHEQKFTEIDVALWDKVMAVNLRGPFLMAKHVAPEMAKRKYGKIINIGSGTAVRGIPWIMHYATSKGGIIAMTRSMSRELGDDGIRVNTLMPGFTLSDSIVEQNPGHVETARGRAIASRALKRDDASGGPARHAGVPGVRRQRFHHRADDRGRWREREYVDCHPGRAQRDPGSIYPRARWVPALASLGRDDSLSRE